MIDLTLGVLSGTLAVVELAVGRSPSRLVVASVCVVVAVGFHPAWRRCARPSSGSCSAAAPTRWAWSPPSGTSCGGAAAQEWLEALRASVDLPSVALHDHGEVVASAGDTEGYVTTIALQAGEDHVGDLVVGLPEHLRELPRATHAVLRLVAGPLARALQSARLADELQRSRRRVVLAAEEERRRLQRDLHDGLGPVLAGVAYTADAARNDVATRPQRAVELLAELRGDVTGAIAEVRRIVHDLRPRSSTSSDWSPRCASTQSGSPTRTRGRPSPSRRARSGRCPPRSRSPPTGWSPRPCSTPSAMPGRAGSTSRCAASRAPSTCSSSTTGAPGRRGRQASG